MVRRLKLALLVIYLCGISAPHIAYIFLNYSLSGHKVTEAYYKLYASLENEFYNYLPMIIILIGNTTIIYKMHTMAKSQSRHGL